MTGVRQCRACSVRGAFADRFSDLQRRFLFYHLSLIPDRKRRVCRKNSIFFPDMDVFPAEKTVLTIEKPAVSSIFRKLCVSGSGQTNDFEENWQK